MCWPAASPVKVGRYCAVSQTSILSFRIHLSQVPNTSKPVVRLCRTACASGTAATAATATTAAPTKEQLSAQISHLFSLNNLSTREEFFGVMKGFVKQKLMQPELVPLWEDFYSSYSKAVLGSGIPEFDNNHVLRI